MNTLPRRKPVQDKVFRKKPNPDFKVQVNYDHSCSVPCSYHRCSGFMFLVTATYGEEAHVVDELECFVCKKIKRLGDHDPNRAKPKPFPPRDRNKRPNRA